MQPNLDTSIHIDIHIYISAPQPSPTSHLHGEMYLRQDVVQVEEASVRMMITE